MTNRPYVRPTAQQKALLNALVATGDLGEAAGRLGLTYGTARSYLDRARRRSGFRSNEQMIAIGVRDGWIVVHEWQHRTVDEGLPALAAGG